jgi:hypothetical protein
VFGTVNWIAGNVISVATDDSVVDVAADERTEIWKGRPFHDLSPVHVGDDFSARCRADSSGKLVAEAIWLNIVNVSGVITNVSGDGFEMFTNPNADPESSYVKENLKILIDQNTIFNGSAKEDLKVGRDIEMVGLDLKNGAVGATRLTVYENKRPIRIRDGKILPPSGPQK